MHFGSPVAKPVDIFGAPRSQRKTIIARARRIITKNRLLQRVFKKLAGYNIVAVKKAPFDFVITVPEENMKIIGGVANSEEKTLSRRVEEILSLSKVVQAHPVLVTDGQKPLPNKDISCVKSDEISKIKCPEDLCKL
jgi:predicted transcriptional regulator